MQGSRRAEEDLANGKAKKGKSKRGTAKSGPRRRGAAGDAVGAALVEAGPPVSGAFLRIDEWPTDGNGAMPPGQARHMIL